MNYYPRFAQLLDQYLSSADRSGSWLAQRIGVNPGTVTRWRNGESRPRKPEVVIKIADCLAVRAPDKRREFLGAAEYAYIEGDADSAAKMQASAAPGPDLRMASHLSFNFELTDAVLIATLGSEPQVIAIAAQLLQRQSEPLSEVVVLHTAANKDPIGRALPAIRKAFADNPDWPQLIPKLIPTDDILTPEQIDVFARELYGTLKHYVSSGARIHLLLAGGRKSMAMVGVTVAQLLLGPDDRIWYLHSSDALRFSGRFGLEVADQAELIQVPLPQMRTAPAVYTQPFQEETPRGAFEALAQEQQRRLQRFVEQELTPAERELSNLIIEDVVTVVEMAQRLNKKPKTVTNQLNSIYAKLEATFGLQPDKGVKREFLRKQLGSYFEHLRTNNSNR